jgi:RNA polymerase sigma factor (sigma-70 family)
MTGQDDHQLLTLFTQTDSQAAFATLVQRHVNLVYSVALRKTGQAHAAEEITQAVFIILARKADKLPAATVISGWLYQTTRLTAANYLRTESRRIRREQEAFMQSQPGEPESHEAWQSIAPLLDDALGKLGESDRNAVVLRFFEDKSLAEISTTLKASEAAAKMRVNRALEKLRKILGKRGVTLPATLIAGVLAAHSVQAAPVGLAVAAATAATKSAVVGGSTLALVNGALKFMAWTKAKTAIAITAGILFAGGATTAIVEKHFAAQVPTEAYWNDDPKALDAASPLVILQPSRFPASRAGGIFLPQNGKLAIRHQPASILFIHAYNWSSARTILSTKLPVGFFDYLVTLPTRQGEALQQKIREELGIAGRYENRMVKAYVIRSANDDAPGLKPSTPGSYQQIDRTKGVTSGPLSTLWFTLESYLQTPVMTEDGLREDHDMEFEWDQLKVQPKPGITLDITGLRRELRNQLGLDLIETNRIVEMLVLDRVK